MSIKRKFIRNSARDLLREHQREWRKGKRKPAFWKVVAHVKRKAKKER